MPVVYLFLGIIAGILFLGLLVGRKIGATREVVINKPAPEVFNYIKYLKNQDNFSKWASMDPHMKKEYRGTDATPGFISAWAGNKKVGKGEQEIMEISEGNRVNYEIRFEKPFKSVARSVMTTEALNESSTKVTWAFEGKMSYPMNVVRAFMNMDKEIGDDFSTGLNKLKAVLEK